MKRKPERYLDDYRYYKEWEEDERRKLYLDGDYDEDCVSEEMLPEEEDND